MSVEEGGGNLIARSHRQPDPARQRNAFDNQVRREKHLFFPACDPAGM